MDIKFLLFFRTAKNIPYLSAGVRREDGELGIGDRALGIGNRALGTGHWAMLMSRET
jgi:hypothetical protein